MEGYYKHDDGKRAQKVEFVRFIIDVPERDFFTVFEVIKKYIIWKPHKTAYKRSLINRIGFIYDYIKKVEIINTFKLYKELRVLGYKGKLNTLSKDLKIMESMGFIEVTMNEVKLK